MNVAGELLEFADQVGRELTGLDEIREQFEALREAASEVGRSWSGSNLGYHARVYYRDFQPVPAGVLFSAEWGLEERWPVHTPDPGWMITDGETPRKAVIARAGGVDPRKLEKWLAPFRSDFDAHKENLVSILMAAAKSTKDEFLEKRRAEIEELEAPDPTTLSLRFLPQGQIMTRDTQALTGGRHVAAHQSLLALSYSAKLAERGLRQLVQVARLTAAHVQRLNPKGKMGVQTGGVVTFVGHGRSTAWLELKDFLKDRLGLLVSEFNAVSAAGIPTVDRLKEMLDTAAFAFIVMTGEDEQPDGQLHARQNVIHEAGLFQGRLGFGKAIILLEEGCSDFSNIHGLGVIMFSKGKIGSAFEDVRRVLEREQITGAG